MLQVLRIFWIYDVLPLFNFDSIVLRMIQWCDYEFLLIHRPILLPNSKLIVPFFECLNTLEVVKIILFLGSLLKIFWAIILFISISSVCEFFCYMSIRANPCNLPNILELSHLPWSISSKKIFVHLIIYLFISCFEIPIDENPFLNWIMERW